MAKVIKAVLSAESLKQASEEIIKYKKEILDKNRLFVERLANKGITVGYSTSGNFEKYVSFHKEIVSAGNSVHGLVVMKDAQKIVAEWQPDRVEIVSPMLMAEFGSGRYADGRGIPGVGRGTFPNQTHAFENSWFWVDMEGNPHHSSGTKPTRPMLNAATTMIAEIETIAREVFG